MSMCRSSSGRSESLEKLAQRLRLLKPDNTFDHSETPNKAAVLICLFEGENGELRVILTKRSSTLSSHSGEVALPGGKREDSDQTNAETALREANEEIGLDPSLVEVLTVLQPFSAARNIIVFPVFGILWKRDAFNPNPNADEVESVFDVPLEMFLKNENRREKEVNGTGYKYLIHFFDYQSGENVYIIWALTAAILINVASIVYNRPPAFEERMPKFWNRSRH